MNKLGTFLLILVLASSAYCEAIATNTPERRSGSDTEDNRGSALTSGNGLAPIDASAERYNVQFSNNKLANITKFENVPAGEDRLIKDMILILQRMGRNVNG